MYKRNLLTIAKGFEMLNKIVEQRDGFLNVVVVGVSSSCFCVGGVRKYSRRNGRFHVEGLAHQPS